MADGSPIPGAINGVMYDPSLSSVAPVYRSCNPEMPVSCNRPRDCSDISGNGGFLIYPFGIENEIEALCEGGSTKLKVDNNSNLITLKQTDGSILNTIEFSNIDVLISGSTVSRDQSSGKSLT